MTFPAYPAYKKSGVQWIGNIPEHWCASRLRNIFFIQKRIAGKLGFDVLSITNKGVKIKDVDSGDGQLSSDYSKYQLVMKGEFAMNHMDLVTGYVDISEFDGVTSPDYRVFSSAHPELDNPRFMLRLLQNAYHQKLFFPFGQGSAHLGRWRLPTEEFKDFFFPRPSRFEQTQIARFLDHETARIDALIEEQQRLIELLKEKRQAVISHAVTKGLDPTVPLKDSGVEWLGEVPAHWDVARVKNVATLESGHTPSKDFPEYWEGGDIPWVSLNDSKKLKVFDYIEETQFMITELGVKNSSARLLPARAVVFTRDASIGLAAITMTKMCVSQHLIAWICNESLVLPEYLLLVFYAMKEELDRFTFGATIKTIGMPDIRKLVTPVPPLTEQTQVVADVNVKRELIERLIQESNNALTLHSERRSALISAAVTGKIDVRGWQPPASAASPQLAPEAV